MKQLPLGHVAFMVTEQYAKHNRLNLTAIVLKPIRKEASDNCYTT